MSNDVIPYQERVGALSVQDVRAQVNLIQEIMSNVMQKDQHYGVIPGTQKPSLLKAGAEKLCLTFRLDPQYDITERHEGAHLHITSKCTLYHIPSGQRFGSGMGSCSTRESKYAYRSSARKCPKCASEAIIKGKEEYGGGWVCFKKKGGCGAKFTDDAPEIVSQATGRVANEDLADQYNTVLKMANKRSLVAAVLNATAASDIFTQDVEDMPQFAGRAEVVKDEDASQEDTRLKVAPEQIEAIHVALSQNNVELTALLAKAELTDLKDMASDDAMPAIVWIKKQGEKAADAKRKKAAV